MVEEHVVEWTRQWKQQGLEEGRKKGLEEGRIEGRIEGEAAVVRHLLQRKFGPLDAATQQRIAAADADTLLKWSERVLTAATLAEVFDNA